MDPTETFLISLSNNFTQLSPPQTLLATSPQVYAVISLLIFFSLDPLYNMLESVRLQLRDAFDADGELVDIGGLEGVGADGDLDDMGHFIRGDAFDVWAWLLQEVAVHSWRAVWRGVGQSLGGVVEVPEEIARGAGVR
jgi:hypothetical protein